MKKKVLRRRISINSTYYIIIFLIPFACHLFKIQKKIIKDKR